ncbi:MAG: putative metal-binding motif-containing protein, partial [Myxococcota bacterium]|nr:putative metal-binding motif-containing protein [Myxococcota bacterium]
NIADLSASPCGFDDGEAIDCRDDDPSVMPDPTIAEVAYNGTDDNCDASDGDGDRDGDGHWAIDYGDALAARGVVADDTVSVPEILDDCWDDDEVDAADAGAAMAIELRVLDGFDALTPADVFPGAADRPYDGANQDCAGQDLDGDGIADDFDWDGDGYASAAWPDRGGSAGGDCIDCPSQCTDGSWTGTLPQDWCDALCSSESANPSGLDPATVHPDRTELWYDGTDQDCDGESDFDADGDGFDHVTAGGADCIEGTSRDTDPNPGGVDPAGIRPDATETWYDGTDQDCNGGSDYDADADGYDADVHGGGDCIEGTAIDTTANGAGIAPALVNPGATDVWYDGTDQDCSGGSDLDADRDGFDHASHGGTDCMEGTLADTDPNPSGAHPATVRPGAAEVWYDGTDDDCDGNDGDADGDGHAAMDYGFIPANGDPVDDCDDNNATTHPGATEIIGDEVDQDCDDAEICYVDGDGDGVRADSATVVASADTACTGPGEATAAAASGDCDDGDNTIAPGNPERCDGLDNDCNGFLAGIERDIDGDGFVACTEDAGGWDGTPPSGFGDCNDFDATVLPGAAELCDGLDNDCDGTIPADENDSDFDGYVICAVDAGGWDGVAVAGGDDCDDTDPATYVGATEVVGDGVDQDCDGTELCFIDADGDGVHDGATTVTSRDIDCDDPGEIDNSTPSGDCNDADATIHAGAVEVTADGVDQDCDGGEICYADADDDGYRPDATQTTVSADSDCDDTGEAFLTEPTGDCDDTLAGVNPAAAEVCDAADLDEDCDGLSDDDDDSLDLGSTTAWFRDADLDGFGDASDPGIPACEDPSSAGSSFVIDASDCDDGDATISPAATEICDPGDVDEDCNGTADDADPGTASAGKTLWYVDSDLDGFGDPLLTAALACDDPSDGGLVYAER